jgi:hypothetical protein
VARAGTKGLTLLPSTTESDTGGEQFKDAFASRHDLRSIEMDHEQRRMSMQIRQASEKPLDAVSALSRFASDGPPVYVHRGAIGMNGMSGSSRNEPIRHIGT